MRGIITIAIILAMSHTKAQQTMTVEEIVQANLDAYNKGDINTFMSYFSEDIVMHNFDDGKITAQGVDAMRAIYEPYFEASPDLHSTILNRTVFGNTIIDHESITGRYGNNDILELVLIYEVKDKKIYKITILRKPK